MLNRVKASDTGTPGSGVSEADLFAIDEKATDDDLSNPTDNEMEIIIDLSLNGQIQCQ